MLKVTIGKTDYMMPLCYEDISYAQYLKLMDVDTFLDQLAVLLKCPPSVLEGSKMDVDTEHQIMASLHWLKDTPDFEKIGVPDKLKLGDKTLEIPKDLDYESFGQRMKAQQLIAEAEKEHTPLIKILPKLVSIYIEPRYNNREFKFGNVEPFEKTVVDASFIDVYKVGTFFLRKYSVSYKLGRSFLKQSKLSWMHRMLNGVGKSFTGLLKLKS